MEEEQTEASEESDTSKVDSFELLEEKARKKVLKSQDRFFDRMMKWDQNDQMEVYVNSITLMFLVLTQGISHQRKKRISTLV